ncbi:MAG: hypothetical protein M1832_003563 [Thelocarpon impressellum]|nr:MAG: hypothetical protein M1832_003563 [Thelocarpon impressellum]
MAAPVNAAKSFDEMIKSDRQRKKNEALASEIFGKGRRASAPGAGLLNRKAMSTAPSLASRRSASAAPKVKPDINGQWGHDLHRLNNPQASRVSQLPAQSNPSRTTRNTRLFAALHSGAASEQISIRGASKGITIRGAAGPFVVMASNFAPGTTSSDIEAAMEPHGGEIVSCKIITAHPTVMAEIVFAEKEGAENVIATFNNQKADGRLLYVYMKPGPPIARPVRSTPTGPRGQADLMAPARDETRDGRGLYSDQLVSARGRGHR